MNWKLGNCEKFREKTELINKITALIFFFLNKNIYNAALFKTDR